MILKKLILMILLTLSVMAEKIELTNVLYIGTEMSQSEIVEKLKNVPDNTWIKWSSGSYELGKINLENKININFYFEKGVTLIASGIYLKSCDNIRFDGFKYMANKGTEEYFTIEDSSNIAIVRGDFKVKSIITNGIKIENSQNILLYALNFKNGIEENYIQINNSYVLIDKSNFYTDDNDKYSIIYTKYSDIEINNSSFSSKFNNVVVLNNSRGTIDNNTFNGLLSNKTENQITAISINDSHIKIVGNKINNYILGISISTSEVDIHNNTIQNATMGIDIIKSKAIIKSNFLEQINNYNYLTENLRFYGIQISHNSSVEIDSNKITNTSCGIAVYLSIVRIENNTISDIFKQGYFNEGVYIHPNATVSLNKNTFIRTMNKYDGIVHYVAGYFTPKITVDTSFKNFTYRKIIALNKAKINSTCLQQNLNSIIIISGELIEDLLIDDTLIDEGEYLKIDKNSNKILFPKEYKGLYLQELPKLISSNNLLKIKSLVEIKDRKQQLYLEIQTKNSIEKIKYKGKISIKFKKKNDLETGFDTYSFSVKLKDSKKEKFFSFIANDDREIIKKFILDKGIFKLIEESNKADF